MLSIASREIVSLYSVTLSLFSCVRIAQIGKGVVVSVVKEGGVGVYLGSVI